MSADFSRWPNRAGRDYASVLLQQGRVLTDPDWNEQVLTTERRERAENLDSLGRALVPTATPDAFKVLPVAGPGLSIGAGRAWVDGLLVENHGPTIAWDPILAERAGGGVVPYVSQPWYPSPPALPTAGSWIAYLKVWQRERTAVEDPELIEPALGVDTGARRQTVWQVKLAQAVAGATCTTALDANPAFIQAEPVAAGRLTTALAVVPGVPNRCRTAPGGGYTGLENQLYRVEVHRGGAVGGAAGATFKWSRDNATVASRVTEINTARDRIVVDRIGRDAVLAIHDGDWIEVTDDERELLGLPGELRRVDVGGGVDQATRTVLLRDPLPAGMFPVDAQGRTLPARNTRLRRWDQSHQVYNAAGASLVDLDLASSSGAITIPGATVQVLLEEGIVVSFSLDGGNRFRTGDYWLFAARTADASVEILDHAPPVGIHAHYAQLAVLDLGAATTSDCRVIVPPLAGLDALEYVAGDGQEATPVPGSPTLIGLPVDPTVGVARGPIRVAGRTVRFTLVDLIGTIGGVAAIGVVPAHVDVVTDLAGLAAAPWALDPTTPVQRMRVDLLDAGLQPTGLPVIFSARLRTADEVAYDPTNCGGPNGPKTVQAALDELCAREMGTGCCETVAVTDDLIERIRKAAEKHDGHVCICLLPGDHPLKDDAIPKLPSLTIHGHGARLVLGTTVHLSGIRELTIEDVAIVNEAEKLDALLELDECETVTLRGITATLDRGTDGATALRFGSNRWLRLRDSVVENLSRDRAPAAPPVDRTVLPAIVRSIVELAESRPTSEMAVETYRAIMEQPADIREAAAAETAAVVELRREELGVRSTATLGRLAEAVRTGADLPPSRFATLLDQARRLGDAIPVGGPDLGTAIEILDGRTDAWIGSNVITGAVVLYGSGPQASFERRLTSALEQIKWTDVAPDSVARPPLGGGRLRLSENVVDRVTLAAAAAERITAFVLKGPGAALKGLTLFESIFIEGNELVLPTQAVVGETVVLAANRIGGKEGESLGCVYAGAATVATNTGPGAHSALVAGAPDRITGPNLRMTVVP